MESIGSPSVPGVIVSPSPLERPPLLEIPVDGVRGASAEHAGPERQRLILDAGAAVALERLARRGHGPAAALAVWTAALHRWAGQEELGVAVDRAVVGSRVDLGHGGTTFAEHLAALLSALSALPDVAAPPPANVFFLLGEEERAAGDGLALRLLDLPSGTALELEASPGLLEAVSLRRLLERLHVLLLGAAEQEDLPIAALPFLPEAERHQLLVEWNDTWTPCPDRLIHQLFEEQVRKTPDAVAVEGIVGEGSLTYAELNRRANRLAHFLIGLGVRPDSRVALCLDRSLEMVAAVLAVLKTGSAYVPLDPYYPRERLALMLEDSRAAALLSRGDLADRFAGTAVRTVRMETLGEELARQREDDPVVAATAEALAFVLYTSGSTGRPKGVAMSNRALANMLAWQIDTAPGAHRTLQFTSLSFDVSFQELFATWCSGGTLVLVAEDVRRDSAALWRYLGERRIERLLMPFVAIQQLAEAARQDAGSGPAATLRELFTAGEQLQITPAVADLFRRLERGNLQNHYGPTEGHVVTARSLWGDPGGWPHLPPIGRPIPNYRVVLLDRQGEPVPMGVPGELHMGGQAPGTGGARGYLHRPDLTAERFVPDPFAAVPGGRLYRTGDLARHLPDGSLEYLGRIDHQVKIRGYRVELGEIETVLTQVPGVREAVVVLGEGRTSADRRLAAFLVCDRGVEPDPHELRAFLDRRLPEYMVPSAFSAVESLPLTPSGKVNRRALAEAVPGLQKTVPGRVRPADRTHTPTEETLARVWADLLGLGGWESVGPDDDFFELGGDSLLATRAISRVRSAFALDLPLRILFESPTLAELAAQVDRETRRAPAAGEAASLEGERPLSFAQERLWFLNRFEPESPLYNMPLAFRIEGPLRPAVLAAALDGVVRRHEVLRTSFPLIEGEARPRVAPFASRPLPVVDLGGLPGEVRAGEAGRVESEVACRTFDLQEGPLVRTALLALGSGRHALLVSLHHIVSDGWSVGVLAREMGALYRAAGAGEPSPLAPLPLQYSGFARWQRRWLREGDLDRQLVYWKERLAGLPTVDLPADRPRSPVLTHRGAVEPMAVPGPLIEAAAAVARQHGATLFMALLAAFQALVCRWTGQDDVPVGTPIANRNRTEIEDLIGFFVNTLVLRADFGGDPDFAGMLGRTREAALGAYAHQDVPFEKLVEALSPERDLTRTPLFQVLFSFQNALDPRPDLGPGFRTVFRELKTGTSKFDFTLDLQEPVGATGGWRGEIEYSADLFDAATVRRMNGHFLVLLEEAASHPEARLSELPLLTGAEREQLLGDWAGRVPEPREETIDGLFAERAARHPEAVAVELGEERLTYAELDRRAGLWAAHLRRLGVGPEVRVAVCLERSAELIVALVAVLRAGGAYVPLDPEYPRERLELMLEDSGAAVLVTQARFAGELPLPASGARWIVDGEPAMAARAAMAADPGMPEPRPVADNLAYIIYTSGSTGRPKGVAVPHRGVVRLVRETDFARLEGEVYLQFAPISFDASVLEIWGCLLNGGRLVVMPPGRASLEELAGVVERHGVTTLWLTSAVFQQVVEGQLPRLRPVRQLLAGGDVLPPASVRRCLEELPGTVVINGYGPTENTTFTCTHPLRAGESVGASVPIGRPIRGTDVFVVDRSLRPVPVGVAGELLTGGEGLARGYEGRPDLTAERFIPHPFSTRPGERVYRTGDLARWQADGTVAFLGRIDQQVKVRGFRVEPGEIEQALLDHPGVREASVIVLREAAGDERLAAFVALRQESAATAAELRARLQERLPAYLVPSAIVPLAELPLSPNGKVDRRALAKLSRETGSEAGSGAPRTPIEQLLAGIWAEVLRRSAVGIHDNFFDLGGHSLLATRVLSRVRAELGAELPLRELFRQPTVAGLAGWIESHGRKAVLPPIAPVSRQGGEPLPLSFSQERLWFLDRLLADRAVYNVPLVLGLSGELDREALRRTLEEIVRRHEVLRTRFPERGGEPYQEIEPSGRLPLPEIDLRGLPQAGLERLREAEMREPFDLAAGPLIRARLALLGETEAALLLTMHHIVSDGWSLGVLLEEIAALYPAFAADRPSPLPELPVQFADFAVWQRSWLQGEALRDQILHWTRELAGAPTRLELPADRPRPAVPRSEGGERSEALPGPLAEALRALARRNGATLFMVLLAGFQTLLHRLTGQDDLLVGSPFAGRDRGATEGMVGFFVNTLVLRGRMPAGTRFRDLVEQARSATLSAYAHQDLPFEKLVEELRVERSLSHTPVFQVLFTFQEAPPEAVGMPGLVMRPLPVRAVSNKFDLSLVLAETPGGGLAATVRYLRDLFDDPTPGRFLAQLRTLLEGAAADPGRSVAELPLLPEHESQQVLVEANDVRREAPAGWTVVRRFEEWVERTPEAPALAFEGKVLSYRELGERTARLAGRLRALGVGPETPVAVRLERSLEMMVAVLGVLRAGGAYVPLDPDFPAERFELILRDSGALVVLDEESLGKLEDPSLPGVADGGAPSPGSLAYLIYTSGSTGLPKGVAVEHRQLASYLDGVLERMALPPGCSYATVSTLAADLGNTVVYAALATGGCLHVISRERLADGEALGGYFERHGIDCLKIVPSHLAALLSSSRPAACLPRRLLVVGGESTRWELAGRVRELAPECRLLNHYGPTETTVGVLTREIAGPEPGRQPNIPLGRPIRGTRVALLDRNGEPAPLGVPGELHVGGANVSRGYPGRPDLTAARFVPDPWGAGERLYATGDLARQRPDGVIEFLGRVDHQVKIRGFRVELGEIEAALAAHPEVDSAVVLAREVALGDRRLAAFVVSTLGAGELASWLRARLPEAMIPSSFTALDALPLTANGKVDRRALEELAGTAPGDAHVSGTPGTGDGPRTPAEEIVAGIFADLLGLERVGPRGHFFELGGHSLLATRALSRLRDAFAVELPLRALFESPTVAGLAARIGLALSGGEEAAPPVRPVPREGDLPLSFAQERLWLLDRMAPGLAIYNVPFALRLSGPLSLPALERSLAEIVRRHEVLRSVFPYVDGPYVDGPGLDGRPVQRVTDGVPSLPEVDLRALPEGTREAEAERVLRQEARRPFDLARGPLLRAALLRTADREAALSLHLHHIASDGWSRRVFAAEQAALYPAFVQGLPSPLPPLPVQYADFAVWQRERLQGEALERQIAFWKAELDGAPRLLELPADRPRPAVQSFRGGLRLLELPPGLARAVRELARRQGATLFMTLVAAWQALLGRISGQEDVLVGTPVSGRNRSEIEGLIGFFVNTLVLRGRMPGDATFRGMVAQAKSAALAAYSHQELPFERLVEELQVERSLAHNPLFQTVFTLEDEPAEPARTAGLALSPIDLETGTAKFDLSLAAAGAGDRLGLVLEHAADLFDPATADRILGWLRTLLESALAAPGAPVAELPLLAGAERQQLLGEWNDTFLRVDAGTLVHQRVEAWASIAPGKEAVAGVTYGELDARANRLARHLRRLGTGPEARVGVLLERSAELVLAELAVLKAGGAYLPLDASYPADRLAFMLEDSWRGSSTPVLLAREELIEPGLRERLEARGARVLTPESWGKCERAESADRLPPLATPRSLAYVIYTSGSTGQPKGVEIEHGGLLNLVTWHQKAYGVTSTDRASLLAGTAFDASVWETWPYLAAGAALRVPGEETRADPARLAAWLAAERITLAFLPTPLAEAVLAEPWPAGAALRGLLTGGDRLHQGPPPGLGFRLVNHYGPTESTVVATCGDAAPGEVSPPIGRPIANTRVLLLDRRFLPVPPGVPGELCVAGAGLARGYSGRPDLTAERFVPDPHGSPGDRLYRTGDLARWRPDGALEFLGRIDFQVKLRGYRIELGEIEAVLASHPGLRAAAVLVQGSGASARLVAYAVPGDPPPAVSGLRSWLAGRLPEPMVPTAWRLLSELPLTPNGKVDRRALARLEAPPEPGSAEGAPPATPTEEIFAALWSELLGVERVGTRAGFFDLGGHSLKAAQLVARIRTDLGVELPLRAVFESPTVAALAARVDELRAAGEGLQAPPVRPVPRDRDLPLSYSQEPLWFLQQMDPAGSSQNVFCPLTLDGELDEAALLASVRTVVCRHESLRTVFPARNGVAVQAVLPPPDRLPGVVDLRGLPGAAAEPEALRLALAEGRRPFDLARGPVFRAALVRVAPRASLLLLNAHHAVTDGWSTGILLRDLTALYTAAVTGAPADLPELPVQYADFAVWQREWLQGEILERQLGYWKRELAGAPPVIDLPLDRPRPAAPSWRSGVAMTVIPAEAAAAIREAGRRLGATLFMTCLAAFQILLHRDTGQDDVVVGTPVANRGRRETEELIGCFLNTLALRGRRDRPESATTFRELLARVRASALDAYVHQDLSFDRVVDGLRVERSLRYNPVFQVLFSMNPPLRMPEMPGLRLGTLDQDDQPAKLDLALGLGEVDAEIWGGFRYSAELFDPATVERMLGRFRALLEQAAASPDRPLCELAPWTDAELRQVLSEAAAEPAPETEDLDTRIASRGQKVEDLRANLSDAKKAMLAKLLKKSPRP